MEFFRKEYLQKIGNGVGKTLKIDSHSIDGGRRKFAAVCALVDEHKTLHQRVFIGKHAQELMYVEGPWWCSYCKQVGHGNRNCRKKPPGANTDSGGTFEQEQLQVSMRKEENWAAVRRRGPVGKKTGKGKKVHEPTSRWTPKKWDGAPGEVSKKGTVEIDKIPVKVSNMSTHDVLETSNPFDVLQNVNSEAEVAVVSQATPTEKPKRGPPFYGDDFVSLTPKTYDVPSPVRGHGSPTPSINTPPSPASHLSKKTHPKIISPLLSQNELAARNLGHLTIIVPSPLSPTFTPPQSPPPPRLQLVRNETSIYFARPVRPLLPELNPGYIDYLLPEDLENPSGVFSDVSLQMVKLMMLNLLVAPEIAQNMIMYANSEIMIPHVPQFQMVAHLPPVMKIFLEWFLRREVLVETEDRDLLQNLGSWLDPAPLLPMVRTVMLLELMPFRVHAMSNTNALVLVKLQRPLKQLGMNVSWEEGRGRKNPRETEMMLWPHRRMWTCPKSGVEVDPWGVGNEEVLRRIIQTPNMFKNMTILFWNVRGIGRPSFLPNFRLLMQQHTPSMVVLVETWVSREKTTTIVSSMGMDSWHLVEPLGFVGGILLLWNSYVIDFQPLGEGAQGVHGVMEVHSLNISFIFSAIYASPKFYIRRQLWDDLRNMAISIDKPWLLVGDYNDVLCQNEKLGGRRISTSRANLYAETMDSCNLVDLGFCGPKFTWTNKRKRNPIYERLDRGWANIDWLSTFPEYKLTHLPRVTSDHCPILVNLSVSKENGGQRPFRFEPNWTLDNRFLGVIDHAWPRVDIPLTHKLDCTKEALISWNRDTFGNIFVRKKAILARIRGTQIYLQSNPTSIFHQNLETDLQNELLGILDQEELLWRTKSRLERIGKGERNTGYFHRSVMMRRASNRILCLRDEVGREIHEPVEIKERITHFYRNLYTMDHDLCYGTSWEGGGGGGPA